MKNNLDTNLIGDDFDEVTSHYLVVFVEKFDQVTFFKIASSIHKI